MAESAMEQDWLKWADQIDWIDQRAQSLEEFWALGRSDAEMILADLTPPLTADSRVLELGCGWGRILKAMAPRFREVWGVDTSTDSLAHASREMASLENVRLVQNSGFDLFGLPDGYFDLCYSIFMFDCLPSTAVVRGYVEEARRVLREGGIFKAQVGGVYAGNPFRPLYADDADTWHGARFTLSEISGLLEAAGFEMVSAYHAQTPQQLLRVAGEDESATRQYRLWVTARKGPNMDRDEAAYFALGQALARLAEGASVITPDRGMDIYLVPAGDTSVRFIHMSPPDSRESAIDALARCRTEGGRYLSFTRFSLWWLESYPDLAAHLDANARRVDTAQDYRIYDLGPD